MSNNTYTLSDLEQARAELKRWMDAAANDTSGNPDKHRSRINDARRDVRHIEATLKASGAIPLTEQEQLEQELDAAFPNANHNETVEHGGKKYMRWFRPAEKSRSGKTVHEWDKGWTEVAG